MTDDRRLTTEDHIETELRGNTLVVHLPVHYSIVTGAQIIELEDQILESDIDKITIDARRLTEISSFGLEYKILEQNVNMKKSVEISLINVSNEFQNVINLMTNKPSKSSF
jgi:anti-anti-sigma regulatory factor